MAEKKSGGRRPSAPAPNTVVREPITQRGNFFSFIPAVRQAQQQNAQDRLQSRSLDDAATNAQQDNALMRDAANLERQEAERNRLRNAQRSVLGALRQTQQNGGDIGAAFDQFTPILPALGVSPEQVAPLREQLVQDPAALDALELALRDPTNSRLVAAPQAAYNEAGEPVFVAFDRDGRATEISGYSPAQTVLGERRAGIAESNLGQRQLENSPEHRQDVAAATALGTAQGEVQSGLDLLEETVTQINERVDALTSNADLGAVLGLPSLRGITRGGLGSLGPPIPGTRAANVLAQLRALSSQVRLQAYESLRGAGQITEAESLFGEQAQGNLDRIQSPEAMLAEIEMMRDRLNGRLRAARRSATRRVETPNGSSSTPAQPRRSVDDLLQQYAPQ